MHSNREINKNNIAKERIHQKIKILREVFDIKKLLNFQLDNQYVKKYYLLNKIPYSLFHSRDGFIHFAICPDGKYLKEGLLYQPKKVAEYIKNRRAINVLELACGRGANLNYLAGQFKDVNFYGLDLSPAQLHYTRKITKRLKNIKMIERGDMHDLTRYEDEKFDIIFIFESLCYSEEKQKVFYEVKRILKPEGLFIVADAYWNKEKPNPNTDEYIVKRLSELGMALNEYEPFNKIENYSNNAGFMIIEQDDVTKYLLANCNKFEKLFARFISSKWKARILKTILPDKIIFNGFVAYSAGDAIRDNWAKYFITIFKKI